MPCSTGKEAKNLSRVLSEGDLDGSQPRRCVCARDRAEGAL